MPEPSPALLASLLAAVEAAPHDHALRLHVAQLLAEAGRPGEALPHVAKVLAADPGDEAALAALTALSAQLLGTGPLSDPAAAAAPEAVLHDQAARPAPGFDWSAAEEEVSDLALPVFVEGDSELPTDLERPTVRLADVGGMSAVKDRLDAAFLAPLRNPELRKLYGKSLRGGLLLYGPPGCGKTFLARALAGELGAAFTTISVADVLDMYVGQSEGNVHRVFETVRRNAPCVLFLDEIDALGQKRSQIRGSAMRGAVNQLLVELDDVGASNDGVFVLAATNAPWDVDGALRRPGRLDRTLLVLPPDEEAREAILRYHLKDRPVAGVELRRIVKATDGFSGADLKHLCDTASERALLDSARSGTARMIEQRDMDGALREVRPSTGPWMQTARNVAQFANDDGEYDDLLAWLKQKRLL